MPPLLLFLSFVLVVPIITMTTTPLLLKQIYFSL